MTSPFRAARRGIVAGLVIVFWVACPSRLVGADDASSMAVDLVTSEDADFRDVGLDAIRHGVKGEAATRAFAALLEKLPADRQIELLRALADRGDPAALPALVDLLGRTDDPAVRTATLAALGSLGTGDAVPVLMKSLAAGGAEHGAARHGLVSLRGEDATRRIVAAVKTPGTPSRQILIEILAERRARSALPDLESLVTDSEGPARQAAMRFLGVLGRAGQVRAMITGLVAAPSGGERQEAERALVAVCTTNPGHPEAAQVFLEAFNSAPAADQDALHTVLGRIGGPGALAIVDAMIANPDASRRRCGLEALALWPDATVVPKLLELVGKATEPAERDLLIGALIRIAPLPDNKLDDAQKLDLVKRTLTLCVTDAERARLLERGSAIRTIETFRFVVPYLDQPALAASACRSVVELAHHQQLRDTHKTEFIAALDKVIATTPDGELVERANRYKEGKTWERKR